MISPLVTYYSQDIVNKSNNIRTGTELLRWPSTNRMEQARKSSIIIYER